MYVKEMARPMMQAMQVGAATPEIAETISKSIVATIYVNFS